MFTAKEKYVEAQREVAMRVMVYPRWIEQKKMTTQKAERQIAIMKAIADDYLAASGLIDQAEPGLFDHSPNR